MSMDVLVFGVLMAETYQHYFPNFKKPIPIKVVFEDGEYIASTIDLPLWASDNNKVIAIRDLELELDDYYQDLLGFDDDEIAPELHRHKSYLIEHFGGKNT